MVEVYVPSVSTVRVGRKNKAQCPGQTEAAMFIKRFSSKHSHRGPNLKDSMCGLELFPKSSSAMAIWAPPLATAVWYAAQLIICQVELLAEVIRWNWPDQWIHVLFFWDFADRSATQFTVCHDSHHKTQVNYRIGAEGRLSMNMYRGVYNYIAPNQPLAIQQALDNIGSLPFTLGTF